MSHEDISLSEQEEIRREKLAQLNEMGVNPYPYSFDVTHTSQGIKLDSDLVRDEESNPGSEIVSIAGRIMTRRIMRNIDYSISILNYIPALLKSFKFCDIIVLNQRKPLPKGMVTGQKY